MLVRAECQLQQHGTQIGSLYLHRNAQGSQGKYRRYLSRVTVAGILALKILPIKHSFSLNGLLLIDINYSDTMTILKMTLLITLNTGDITYNDIS
jgi:hypothetical protein